LQAALCLLFFAYFFHSPLHSMTSYQQLLSQKEELDRLIAQARKTESTAALASVRQLIKEFGFTAQQVFPWEGEKKAKAPVKYYDPNTGAKWTGRGKPPKWIAGKDYAQFLLAEPMAA
jgi:DNA-binding protein H-NS